MQEYFQAIRNRVGPKTVDRKERETLLELMQDLRAGQIGGMESRRVRVRAALEKEWRPGSLTEYLLVDQLVETVLRLSQVGTLHDAAIRMAIQSASEGAAGNGAASEGAAGDGSEAEAIVAALSAGNSGVSAVQQYERSLVRQQRQLIKDLRALQEQRALTDEEADWAPAADAPPSRLPRRTAAGMPMSEDSFAGVPRSVKERLGGVSSDEWRMSSEGGSGGQLPVVGCELPGKGESGETKPMEGAVAGNMRIGKTKPISSQGVNGAGVAGGVGSGAQWPTGPIVPMRLADGEMFDEWNRPDRG